MPRWLVTLIRLTPTVAGVSLAAVLGLIGFRQLVPLGELRAQSDAVGNYLQTVGGIYAVLLAFVVYVVWGQFNEAKGLVEREAAALVDLYRTAAGLPDATRGAIQQELRAYVDAVLAEEWAAMARRDEKTIEGVGALLDAVWTQIHECEPRSTCEHTVHGEVLSRFNDLSDIRTRRLISADARIPLALKILLYAGALITIGSVYFLAFDQLWIHASVTAALAGAIAHILYIILDLDDAFSGDWQVAKTSFVRARRSFERNAVTL